MFRDARTLKGTAATPVDAQAAKVEKLVSSLKMANS